MAMNSTSSISAPIQNVLDAFTSEDFVRTVSQRAGVQFQSMKVSGDTAGAFTVTTVRTVGADKVPEMAKKFVKSGVSLTQEDSYSAPQPDGSRTISSKIDVAGMPVSAEATQQLKAAGERTDLEIQGEVRASIPLVGKKLAGMAEPYMGRALALQATVAEEWIQKNR